MLENEGITVLTTYLQIRTTESDDQDAAYLMYDRNSRNDNAWESAQTITYGDCSVSFQRPSWRRGAPDRNDTPPQKGRGVICHICYRQSDHIALECTLTFSEKEQVVRNFESLDEGNGKERHKISKEREVGTYEQGTR